MQVLFWVLIINLFMKCMSETVFSFTDPFIEDLKSWELFGLKFEVIHKLPTIKHTSVI